MQSNCIRSAFSFLFKYFSSLQDISITVQASLSAFHLTRGQDQLFNTVHRHQDCV